MEFNEYGCHLIDDTILVKPDEVKDTYETKSGVTLYKAHDLDGRNQKMEEAGQQKATIVAISEDAFIDLPEDKRPTVGTRLIMDRHAGISFETPKEELLRLINEGEVRTFINF